MAYNVDGLITTSTQGSSFEVFYVIEQMCILEQWDHVNSLLCKDNEFLYLIVI